MSGGNFSQNLAVVALVGAVEMNLEGLAGYIDARQLFLRDIRTISVGRPVFAGEDAVDLA